MAAVTALQKAVEDAVKQLLASAAPSIQEQIAPAVTAVLPQQGAELSRLQANVVASSLRGLCLDVARDAAAQQQPPMQFVLRGAAGPALPRLMQVAIACHQHKIIDQTQVLQLLDELHEVTVVEHSLDIIAWLEQHRAMLAAPSFKSGHQQLIRLCNAIHRRLGKHDVIHRARLLMLIASCTPLFDRSGVNVQASFAPADPPPVEAVPEDAVDSAGKPVDSTLYSAFWKLQPLVQDPLKVLRSPSEWDTLHSSLSTVLEGLAKSPATVAAVHAAAAPAANGGSNGAADVAMADAGQDQTAAAAAGAAAGGSECYLSSYRLFGLQLADSAFRRGFLVQVLILLRTLLLPGKQPTDTLKDKARMQAVSLEKRVYQLLEATPKDGAAFAAAVKEVLQRETSWVEWKKGSTSKPAGKAAAAAGQKAGAAQQQQQQQGCISWEVPPLAPPMAAAVADKAAATEQASRKRSRDVEWGLTKRQEVLDRSKEYDWQGAPFIDPGRDKQDYLRVLGKTSSAVTFWSQQQMAREVALSSGSGSQQQQQAQQPPALMSGLKVAEQQQYPLPERVCAQLIREMDPEQGMEGEYKRVATDSVYRWRISRAVAQEAPQYEGSLITAEGLQEGMMHELMPAQVRSLVSASYAQQYQAKLDEKKRKEEEEKRARQAGGGGGGQKQQQGAAKQQAAAAAAPVPAPAAAEGGDAAAAAAAVETEPDDAAAGGGGGGGSEAAGGAPSAAAAAIKQEPAEEGEEGEAPAGGASMDVDAAAAGATAE